MPLPIILIVALAIRGVTLSGAWIGIESYIARADWSSLNQAIIWYHHRHGTISITITITISPPIFGDQERGCIADILWCGHLFRCHGSYEPSPSSPSPNLTISPYFTFYLMIDGIFELQSETLQLRSRCLDCITFKFGCFSDSGYVII